MHRVRSVSARGSNEGRRPHSGVRQWPKMFADNAGRHDDPFMQDSLFHIAHAPCESVSAPWLFQLGCKPVFDVAFSGSHCQALNSHRRKHDVQYSRSGCLEECCSSEQPRSFEKESAKKTRLVCGFMDFICTILSICTEFVLQGVAEL